MALLEAVEEASLPAVLEELREAPGLLTQGVVHVQAWYRRQPHLPQPSDGKPLDEQLIRVFLRGCKHDLERTKRKIDAYFTSRGTVPALFQRRDPRGERLQRAMDILHVFPLPRLTAAGHRVTVHRMAPALVKAARAAGAGAGPPVDVGALVQLIFLVGEVRIREEPGAFAGDIFLFDFSGFAASHCAQVLANASLVRDALVAVQEAFPQRMHAIHLFNMHPAMEKILAFVKTIMKEKVRNRFHIHTTVESLHRHVPRAMLPRALGGEEDRDLAREWRRKLESYGPWAVAQDLVVADEARRPLPPPGDKQRAAAQLFGCEGSFRRLAID
ncbi:hypothetical protein R5R35_011186 [Gryllus longicercus]|uniref:CRAL-TRIO domain-containing protein n=1 Tax=Gryllus longicercus TaxID=2509291 RepID=A0AAN9Z0N2_9ORTH